VKLRSERGRKLNGISITPQTIFQLAMLKPGRSALRLSANKMTRATQAAISSKLNKMLVAIRALEPKDT
jgi:hypothetical protein